MSNRIQFIILLFAFISATHPTKACRFTVREIGFSTLSQTNYTFAILDNKDSNVNVLKQLRTYEKDSNIGIVHLNTKSESTHPIVALAKKQGVETPALLLLSPNNRVFVLQQGKAIDWPTIEKQFTDNILDSPLREALRKRTENTFAYILSFDGNNKAENTTARTIIDEACNQIKNVMPLMPKEVRYPPMVIHLSKEDMAAESLLLWSLEVAHNEATPQAVILYGRGRLIGEKLSFDQIKKNLTFKALSMIGADCECGLDRKWMLGAQIPMLWDASCRNNLAKTLGFDVDNPSILAEMSRIMAKEVVVDNKLGVGYGLESIDLNAMLDLEDDSTEVAAETATVLKEDFFPRSIIYTLAAILLISLIASIIILRKKRNY